MPTHRRTTARRILLVAASLAAAGCGAEVYQARVEGNSVPFFNYQRELEGNLGPRWRSANGKISLRLPAAFKEIPPPKKKKDAATAQGPDPRIPPGYDADLPGLLGGFRGTMKADVAGGKAKDVPVHAFVLSNQLLLASREPNAKPLEYDKQLLAQLSAGLRQQRSTGDLRKYSATDGFKATPDQSLMAGFSPDAEFERVAFEPSPADVPMEWQVFFRRVPAPLNLHVSVVFAVPKLASRDEQLKKRIDLSLQTLRIEGAGSPASAAPSGGGAGPDM